jgi:hypothetical protein
MVSLEAFYELSLMRGLKVHFRSPVSTPYKDLWEAIQYFSFPFLPL